MVKELNHFNLIAINH